jgi:hypothetical protein
MLNRVAALVAVLLAFGAPAGAEVDSADEDGPRYLGVLYHTVSGDNVSFTIVYADTAAAERAAERIGLCGFWRVNLATLHTQLVPPGAVVEVHLHDLTAPLPLDIGQRPPELPPLPDVERIVECPAGRRAAPVP